MKEENKETLEQAAKEFLSKLDGCYDDSDDAFIGGAQFGATWQSQHIYTQEQMIAFGEAIKKKCAKEVKLKWALNDIVIVDKRSILSIDINKFLNK